MVATPRSPIFDSVDPELLGLIQSVSANYAPYKVNITSGFRKGDPRYHGAGKALDVQLVDPKTGVPLTNYQDPKNALAYQQLANAVYAAASPEMKAKLRWGGYFKEGGPGTYGALDLMHFDVGGDKTPMAGGSWAGGFSPEQQKLWGLPGGGGVGGGGAPQQGPPDYRAAFLNAIAGPESGGAYDVMYGGQKFSDYSKHPGVRVPMGGPGGNYSTAAGKYQFIEPTWQTEAQKLGLKDFSPESQDKAAWDLATTSYKAKTGRDLDADLRAGNYDYVQAGLGDTWTSLNKGGFSDRYKTALSGGAQGTAPTTASSTGTTDPWKPPSLYDRPAASTDKPSAGDDAFKALSSGFTGGTGGQVPAMAKPMAAMVETQAGQSINPQAQAEARNRLAMALQRLNAGKLVV